MEFTKFLSYGAAGLGLALAILAYRLLQKEQSITKPRQEILKTTYAFMGFALALAMAAFVTEFKSNQKISQAEQKNSQLKQQLSSTRELISTLMDLKVGKVTRLKRLDPATPEYRSLVHEIQNDLEAIDIEIGKALEQ